MHQVCACVPSRDAVVTVGIDLHVELDACLYQSLAIFCTVLEMHVVIGRSVDEQQFSL